MREKMEVKRIDFLHKLIVQMYIIRGYGEMGADIHGKWVNWIKRKGNKIGWINKYDSTWLFIFIWFFLSLTLIISLKQLLFDKWVQIRFFISTISFINLSEEQTFMLLLQLTKNVHVYVLIEQINGTIQLV